ncbi:DIPHTHINE METHYLTRANSFERASE [Salix koriyanagi]|uniref:DIPHTHINE METHYLTRANSFERASE n=1 Tax=Salix koriyanagi TaxID=2511006 RepID=A0A9Q0WDQ9_9ROSI|nr:DIPHTHINE METHYLTRANSFERASE [Salix koriyanagi]
MESGGRASQPTLPDRHMESCERENSPRGIGVLFTRVELKKLCMTWDSLSLIGIDGEKISSKCLCLDWNPPATSIPVGLSDGFVSAFSFPESQLDVIQEWKAHEFELWAASFHIHQPQLVYTVARMIANSVGIYGMILPICYDEYLRLWDVRSISKPVNETLVCSGGGVWRVKRHPYVPGVVLATCMHNGFAVVKR